MKYLLITLFIAYILNATCYAQGDPHMRTFAGQNWEFQKLGDYVLLNTNHLKVHTRQRSWGQTAAVITEVALRFGLKNKIFVRDAKFKTFTFRGKQVEYPAVGKTTQLTKKLKVFRVNYNTARFENSNWKVSVYGYDSNGQRWPQSHYLNVIIDTPLKVSNKWKGACMKQEEKAQGLFTLFVRKHRGDKFKLCTKEKLEDAVKRCKKYNFQNKLHYDNCVFDTCHGFRALKARRFYDRSKKHKKNFKDNRRCLCFRSKKGKRRAKRILRNIRRKLGVRKHIRRHLNGVMKGRISRREYLVRKLRKVRKQLKELKKRCNPAQLKKKDQENIFNRMLQPKTIKRRTHCLCFKSHELLTQVKKELDRIFKH